MFFLPDFVDHLMKSKSMPCQPSTEDNLIQRCKDTLVIISGRQYEDTSKLIATDDDTYLNMNVREKTNSKCCCVDEPNERKKNVTNTLDMDNVYCNVSISHSAQIYVPYKPVKSMSSRDHSIEDFNLEQLFSITDEIESNETTTFIAKTETDGRRLVMHFSNLSQKDLRDKNIEKMGWLFLDDKKNKTFMSIFSKNIEKYYSYIVFDEANLESWLLLYKDNVTMDMKSLACIQISHYDVNTSTNLAGTKLEHTEQSKPYIHLNRIYSTENKFTYRDSYKFIFQSNIECLAWLNAFKSSQHMNRYNGTHNQNNDALDQSKYTNGYRTSGSDRIYEEPQSSCYNSNLQNLSISYEYDIPKASSMAIIEQTYCNTMNDCDNEIINKNVNEIKTYEKFEMDAIKSTLAKQLSEPPKKILKRDRDRNSTGLQYDAYHNESINGSFEYKKSLKNFFSFKFFKKDKERMDKNVTVHPAKTLFSLTPKGSNIEKLINQLNENGQIVLIGRGIAMK